MFAKESCSKAGCFREAMMPVIARPPSLLSGCFYRPLLRSGDGGGGHCGTGSIDETRSRLASYQRCCHD
jgi:hypothetical protein